MVKVTVVHPCVVIATLTVICSSIPGVAALNASNGDLALADNDGPHHEVNHSNAYGHTAAHDESHGVHMASINFEYVRKPLVIAVFVLIVAVCKLGYHHANILSSAVPESCLLIIIGTMVGSILSLAGEDGTYFGDFSSDLFFLYLLPPIILEAAYSLHDRVFFENLGTILLYAVVGTILNCFILAPSLYGLAICGAMGSISITLAQCFVFGALIVAVDPVAVLAIFQEIGVNNVLYFLVFGESLLNDAVTVVIYNTMTAFEQMDTIPVSQVFLGIGAFFTVSLGGLTIGVLIGAICAFFTKYTGSVRVVEPLTIFALAYASYLMAELFHFSGIISIIGCGLMQAQYSFQNISPKSHVTIMYFSKMLSATCDAIIFLFLGLSLVVTDAHVWHTGFVIWSVFLCLIVRFAVVYFLTFFANRLDRLRKLGWEEQFIMAYGGLRGAVAYSLVSLLDKESLPVQPMFMTTTLAVIIFTGFVQGITIKPMVKCLRITSSQQSPVSLYEEITTHATDHVLAGIEEVCGFYGHNRLWEKMHDMDNHYIRQWLMKNPKMNDDNIMDLYEKITLQMHFENNASRSAWENYYSVCQLYRPDMKNPHIDDQTSNIELANMAIEEQLYDHYKSCHSQLPSMAHRFDAESQPTLPFALSRRSNAGESRATVRDRISPSKRDVTPTSPGRRRNSSRFVNVLRKTFSQDTADPNEEEVTIDNVRRWLVANPSRQVFHRKYDRNLTHNENDNLLHHLHEKQRRLQRRRMSLAMSSVTPSASSVPSSHPSPEQLTGRHKIVLNAISEESAIPITQTASSPRQLSHWPDLRRLRMVKSATVELDMLPSARDVKQVDDSLQSRKESCSEDTKVEVENEPSDKTQPLLPKSDSELSIKNRGHLARQKSTEMDELSLPKEDESFI